MADLALDVALLTLGVGVLYYGAEWLVRGSARLSATLGVSPIVVGLTVVSFGTSAPELVVSTVAAFGGNPNLALGNVMGSNLANIGLILGITALVRPLTVQGQVIAREIPLMVLAILVSYLSGKFGGREYFEFPAALSVPIFATWSVSPLPNARLAMNNDIVKPMPARAPPPIT